MSDVVVDRPMDRSLLKVRGGRKSLRHWLAMRTAAVGQFIEPGLEWPGQIGEVYQCRFVSGPADGADAGVRGASTYAFLRCWRTADWAPVTAVYERAPYATDGKPTYLFLGMAEELAKEGLLP